MYYLYAYADILLEHMWKILSICLPKTFPEKQLR